MSSSSVPRLAFWRDNAPWLLFGFGLTLGSSFGQTWYISLYAAEIRATFALSHGEWGGLYTIATLASAALLIQAGRLADTMPLRWLATGLCLLFAGVCIAMSQVSGSPSRAIMRSRFIGSAPLAATRARS